jgi:hypothetical protein
MELYGCCEGRIVKMDVLCRRISLYIGRLVARFGTPLSILMTALAIGCIPVAAANAALVISGSVTQTGSVNYTDTYSVTVTNTGSQAVAGVTLAAPAGGYGNGVGNEASPVQFDVENSSSNCATNSGSTYIQDGQAVTCSIGTLTAGGAATVTVAFYTTNGYSRAFLASSTSPAESSGYVVIPNASGVGSAWDGLAMTGTASYTGPTGHGNQAIYSYTITVTNSGPDAGSPNISASVGDPSGSTFTLLSSSSSACTLGSSSGGSQALNCVSSSNIAAGGTVVFTIQLQGTSDIPNLPITFGFPTGSGEPAVIPQQTLKLDPGSPFTPGTDGPLPLWAYGLLAIAMFWIAKRQLFRGKAFA